MPRVTRVLLAWSTTTAAGSPAADVVPDEAARAARRLRDAGHEVVLAGGLPGDDGGDGARSHDTVLGRVAAQEDVDVVLWLGPGRPGGGRLDDGVRVLAEPGSEALLAALSAHLRTAEDGPEDAR